MRRICFRTFVVAAIIALHACSKSGQDGTPLTVENLAGTYALTALIWNSGGLTINVYDSLDPCEKDNLTQLNINKTMTLIDAGTVCSPPEDGFGSWDLRGDSLFFVSDDSSNAMIQSFDGKTLVLTGAPELGIKATTTLVKQ